MATRNHNHQSSLEASESLRPGNVCGLAASGTQNMSPSHSVCSWKPALPRFTWILQPAQHRHWWVGPCNPLHSAFGLGFRNLHRGAVSLCPLPFPVGGFELSVARNSHWPAIALPSSMLMMIQLGPEELPLPAVPSPSAIVREIILLHAAGFLFDKRVPQSHDGEPSAFHWRDGPSPPTLSCVGSKKGPAIRGNNQKRTTIVR